MQVRLVVLKPQAPAPARAEPPLEIVITDDGKVRVGGAALAPKAFCAKAKELLKGAERVRLKADAKASMKTVAEVMAAVRDQGVAVSLTSNAPGKAGG
jgi:biopolymer transport protein ExbD